MSQWRRCFTTAWALVLAVALSWHASARAEDEAAARIAKYDLKALCSAEPVLPEAGETYTVEYGLSSDESVTGWRPDGDSRTRKSTLGYASRFVLRFDARTAPGVRLPVTVHVSEWTCTGGELADNSLEGRTVSQSGSDTWSVDGGDEGISSQGQEFISGALMDEWADEDDLPFRDALTASMLPDRPVAVGEMWDVATDEFEANFFDAVGRRAKTADASGTGTLVAVADVDGRTVLEIRYELRGGVSELHVGQEDVLDANPDSFWSLTMRVRGTPGVRGDEVTESRFEFDARAEVESGAGIRFQRTKALRVAISRGGEIPAPVREPIEEPAREAE